MVSVHFLSLKNEGNSSVCLDTKMGYGGGGDKKGRKEREGEVHVTSHTCRMWNWAYT